MCDNVGAIGVACLWYGELCILGLVYFTFEADLCIVLCLAVPWQHFLSSLLICGMSPLLTGRETESRESKEGRERHFSFPLCISTSTLVHSLTLGKQSRKARGYAFSSVFWESSAEIPGGLPSQHNVLNPQELPSITPTI